MNNKLLITASLAAVLSSTNVSAGPNPYSDCGIGAALFPNSSTGATISNVIWDLGTTALTSAVSSPETCSGSEAQTAEFIYDSYNDIAEQTAKGEGEHLTAMLNLAGCSASDHGRVVESVRSDFSNSVSQPTYSTQTTLEKSEAYYQSLSVNAQGICSLS